MLLYNVVFFISNQECFAHVILLITNASERVFTHFSFHFKGGSKGYKNTLFSVSITSHSRLFSAHHNVCCLFICLQLRQVLLELKMTCGQILSSLARLKYVQICLCVVYLLSLLFTFSLLRSVCHLCSVMVYWLLNGLLDEESFALTIRPL